MVRSAFLVTLAALTGMTIWTAPQPKAHEWYSEKQDPVYGQSCCGGSDCNQFIATPDVLYPTEEGYRVRLTLEQSRQINPFSQAPIDGLVPWERVQPSEDGNYHICIMSVHRDNMRHGIYCLFVPPST